MVEQTPHPRPLDHTLLEDGGRASVSRHSGALPCIGLCTFVSRQDSPLVESVVSRLNSDNYAGAAKIHAGSK